MNYTFMSDNAAGAHPRIMSALGRANNEGHTGLYGNDKFTRTAEAMFRDELGPHAETFFVFGGTGANVTGMSTMLKPYQAVISADSAHIHQDECGAFENFTGSTLLTVPGIDGKLTIGAIEKQMHGAGDQHHVQTKVISVSQPTEYGTVYSNEELRKLADYAHEHFMFLHMDGARIANAAARPDIPFHARAMYDVGVDVLSFGGTKNGMMYGEAVVFFVPELARDFKYVRKQGMQLSGKMRYIAVQFWELVRNELWLDNARHANTMAALIARLMTEADRRITLTRPVETNAVFASAPTSVLAHLLKEYGFYVWDESTGEFRLMTSWATKEEDVIAFVEYLKRA